MTNAEELEQYLPSKTRARMALICDTTGLSKGAAMAITFAWSALAEYCPEPERRDVIVALLGMESGRRKMKQ